MNNSPLGERLKYHRKLKGFSQEELAQRTTVTVRTIQRIEKQEVNPHLNTVKLLATALEIEVDDLMALENPKNEAIKKKWLLLMHSTPLLGYFIPFLNVLLPLFIWIHKREDNPVYNKHGIKIINFQITLLLLLVILMLTGVTAWGQAIWGFLAFLFLGTIIIVINIFLVLKSEKCFYPLAIPFFKDKNKRPPYGNSLSLIFLVVLMTSCNQNIESNELIRLDNTIITADSLDNHIRYLMQKSNTHGLAVAVFNHNKAVYKNTFGYKNVPETKPLTDSTNIYGASFSKAVFGVLVLKMIEDGVIDLDTPLESYLPKKIYEYKPQTRWHDDYSALKRDSLYHKITARMCLTNTTGFANFRWFEPDEQLRVHFEPGTQYLYSGEGFIYLQVVLEKLTGKGLEELAREIIFDPLKMNQSSYQWQKRFEQDFAYGHNTKGERYQKDIDNEPRGGSTMETSFADYINFLEAVLSEKILSASTYQELYTQQIRIKSSAQFGPGVHVKTNKYDTIELGSTLGWGYLESPYGVGIFKSGHSDGFRHYSILFPESGQGVMIMSNSDNGDGIFKELLEVSMKDIYTPWEWKNYQPI